MDSKQVEEFVNGKYESEIVPVLSEYIRVPNLSPLFDPEWETNGLMDKATKLLCDWVQEQKMEGLSMRVEKEAGRTPLIFIEIAANCDGGDDVTCLMYGHLDKQPPFLPWGEGLHPHEPVRRGERLYGRGGADDGYAVFCAVTAINALKQQGVAHSRIVIIIEACEESGSPDLPFYVDKLRADIGTPSLVVCLDSGCGNYDQLWLTTSLRGVAVGTLKVATLSDGVHSGLSSGIVPSTSRILRMLLDRVEDTATGKLLDALYADIPEEHMQFARDTAATLGPMVFSEFPWLTNVQPCTTDLTDLCLARSWRPTLVVTGIDGVPALKDAGNVMRPHTAAKLSIRLPPSLPPKEPMERFREVVESDPPFGAHVSFTLDKSAQGWVAPPLASWLKDALSRASTTFYNGNDCRAQGEGGSIPFMGMLHRKFPDAQFMIVGVLGPKSNAHGPDEFFHIEVSTGYLYVV